MDPQPPRSPQPRSIAATAVRWAAVLLLMTSASSAESVGDFALFGVDGVDVGGATRVYRGDVGSNGTIRGRQDAWMGGDVRADFVSLDRNVVVSGDVYSNALRLGQNVEIGGKLISPLAIPVVKALPALPAADPGEKDIRVGDGGRKILRPGHYGRIDVGADARLVFTGGEVHAEHLVTGAGSTVLFRRPTILHVASGVELGEDCVLAGTFRKSAARVVVHLSGPGLILVKTDCRIHANLVAPPGVVSLFRGVELAGAALAGRVITGDEIVIDHHPAFDPTFDLGKKCPQRNWARGRARGRSGEKVLEPDLWKKPRARAVRHRSDRCH